MRHLFFLLFSLLVTAPGMAQGMTDTWQLVMKADSCMRAFNYHEATSYYNMALEASHDIGIARKLADAHKRLGHYKECIALLAAIPKDSTVYDDLRAMYFSYRSLEDADSLLQYGSRLLDRNPYDSEALVSVAGFCNANNRPEKALGLCRQYLAADSTNALVLRQYGYAAYLTENYREALHAYLQLESFGFDNYESAFITGISLEQLGQADKACGYLLKAAQHKAFRDFPSLYHLATAHFAASQYDEGVNYLQQAIQLQLPDSALLATLYRKEADAHFMRQRYRDGAIAFENSARYEPERPLTYYNIAQMYEAVGEADKARHYYTLFLDKAHQLKNTDENKDLIETAKSKLAAGL